MGHLPVNVPYKAIFYNNFLEKKAKSLGEENNKNGRYARMNHKTFKTFLK